MDRPYDPPNWYWLATDGRVYASGRQTVVAASDGLYRDWKDEGGAPTPWPRDEAGHQTQAALAAMLAPYGLAIPGYDPVPASVSSAQAKIMLRRAGLLDQVEVLVEGAGGEVAIWFRDARDWERANANVAALGAELQLTSAQIDDLFRGARLIAA